jgi:hypothetical protein
LGTSFGLNSSLSGQYLQKLKNAVAFWLYAAAFLSVFFLVNIGLMMAYSGQN